MKITFPHMGYSQLAIKMLIKKLGHEVIMPKRPSERTLSLGSHYAPEFACLPFKVLLGTYLEALEHGAEMIITSGGVGPCRAGYYGVLHQKILKDLGYDINFLVLEPPQRKTANFLKTLRKFTSGNSLSTIWEAVSTAWAKLKTLDEIEGLTYEIRPYEINKSETTQTFEKCLELIDKAWTKKEIEESKTKCLEMLKSIPADNTRNPLKIGIIGEIYVVLEPAVNFDIQRVLGEMGIVARRSIYLADWTKDNTFFKGEEHIKKTAKQYLKHQIGGHGILSVGNTIQYAQKGYDGIIQLAPFTCIPEIVAKGILTKVKRDLDIPLLTLFLDEQTGRTGIKTRLEAFVDLLYNKRQYRQEVVL